jgi:hypothetical protein
MGAGMKNFWKGAIAGAGAVLALGLAIGAAVFFRERDRRIYEYFEAEYAIQGLREEMGDRPPAEFLDDPYIRGAADNAAADFQRKRDEALQRIRGRHIDRGYDGGGGGGY